MEVSRVVSVARSGDKGQLDGRLDGGAQGAGRSAGNAGADPAEAGFGWELVGQLSVRSGDAD